MLRIFFLLLVLSCGNVFAQNCNTDYFAPDSIQLATDGSITASATSGDTAYLAGDFHAIGKPTGQFLPIDKANGAPVNQAAWPKVIGEVKVALKDGNGGWIIGGQFTKVGDSLRQNLAWIDSNLNVLSWAPTTNAIVNSAVFTDTSLYVGGHFTNVNNTARTYFAEIALDASATLKPLQVNLNSHLNDMALYNDKLWIGGKFDMVNSQPRKYLTAINLTSGSLIATATDLQLSNAVLNPINDMIVKDGNLFVAGYFHGFLSPVTGTLIPRMRILSIDADNGTLRTWQATPATLMATPTITGMDTLGNDLLIVGSFNSINGVTRDGIAMIDCSSGLLQSFNPAINSGIYNHDHLPVTHDDSTIYIGNVYRFNSIWEFNAPPMVTQYGLVAIDRNTGGLKSYNPVIAPLLSTAAKISVLIHHNDQLFLGGNFLFAGGSVRHRIAAIDLKQGSVTDFESDIFTGTPTSYKMKNPIVTAAVAGDNLYIGSYQIGAADTSTVLAGCDRFTGASLQFTPHWTNGISKVAQFQQYDGMVYAQIADYYPYLVRFDPQIQTFDSWSINLYDLNVSPLELFRIKDGVIHSLTAMNNNRYFRLFDINTKAMLGTGVQTFSHNIYGPSVNNMQFIGNKAVVSGRYNYLHNPFIYSQDFRFGIGMVDSLSTGYQTNPIILDEYTIIQGTEGLGPEYLGLSIVDDKFYSIRWMRWPIEPGTDATPRVYDTSGNRHFASWQTNFELISAPALLTVNKDTVYAFGNVANTPYSNIIRFHLQDAVPQYSVILNANPNPAQNGSIVNFDVTTPNTGLGANFKWYKNGQLITNASGSQWSAVAGVDIQNGDLIAVHALDSFLCQGEATAMDQVIVQVDTSTSLTDAELPFGFECFPNPAKEQVLIKGLDKGDMVQVFNLLGRKIYEDVKLDNETLLIVPIANWEEGLYLFKFSNEKQVWQSKIMKLN